jgi:hypothetical protein
MQTINQKFQDFTISRVRKFRDRLKAHVLAEQQPLSGSYRHLGNYTRRPTKRWCIWRSLSP